MPSGSLLRNSIPERWTRHSAARTAGSLGLVTGSSGKRGAQGHLARQTVGRASLIAMAGLGSTASLLFNHVAANRLTSTQASDVRAVIAGLSAVGILALGVQLTLVGWLSRTSKQRNVTAFASSRAYLAAAAAIGLAAGAASSAFVRADLAYRLQIGGLVALAVGAMMLSVLPRAELLNAELWFRLGALMVVGPFVRVVIGFALLSKTQAGANMIPITTGEIIAAACAFRIRPPSKALQRAAPPTREMVTGAFASLGLLLTLVFSSIAFRSKLGDSADTFNGSALVARSVLFLPLTILVLYFPSIARSPLGSRDLRRAYLLGLAWTSLLAFSATLSLLAFPSQLGRLIVTNGTELSPDVIRLLSVGWSLASISMVSLLLYVAHGSRLSLTAWGAGLIMMTGQLFATSATELAAVVLIASAALLIAVSVPAILRVQPILHVVTSQPTGDALVPRGDLALVIPCYNPGPSVVDTIRAAHSHIQELGMKPSIIVVCDGSSDGSAELVDALELEGVRHIRHDRNRGKGAALRTGFEHAHAEFIAFIDADGDLSPTLLGPMLSAQQRFSADIVFGSKTHQDSAVDSSLVRRAYSFGYQRLIRVLFQLDIPDTQTGVKVFRHQVIDAILSSLQEEKFALDLELFISARACGFSNFHGVPVTLTRANGTTISLRSVWRIIADTLRLFWRAKIILTYTRLATAPIPQGSALDSLNRAGAASDLPRRC